jgi:hypothetical protein
MSEFAAANFGTFVNGCDLNEDQLQQVQEAYDESSDIFWLERHDFPFDTDGQLMYDVEVEENAELLKLQEIEGLVEEFDLEYA